ncbi:MAG: nucleotidyltransferase family protein [Bacillota bacterium]|nr:nucleotidyltransferase family protein [Bacillota bacterium]
MRTIGIVSEYNPFHSGHRYMLGEIRKHFGPDCAIVCAMSGNWVQRGDAAIADKWTRAAMALRGGADLVLDLPPLWAVSSAETFARGGVSLLKATGLVDTLCFGSEAGRLEPLEQVAEVLESPQWQSSLGEWLSKGLSFPAARQRAAEALLGDAAACLTYPNNNLGVEYLRALRDLDSSMIPWTISRVGAAHDDRQDHTGSHVSASFLRAQILQGNDTPLTPWLDPEDEVALRADPAALTHCTRGVLARLRAMEEAEFLALPDSGEGLGRKLYQAVREADSLDQVYTLTKSKRYTHARIRRMVLWAFLGLKEADRPPLPPYLRVLGFSPRGQKLLKKMKTTATLPVIVKPAHAGKLAPDLRRLFDLEARCTDLYDLCRASFGETPGKKEYTQSPVHP